MKLMNKLSGEVKEFVLLDGEGMQSGMTLKELAKEWRDVVGEWGCDNPIKLKCGLEVATTDYYEINEDGKEKTEFNFDEALEVEEKTNGEWRAPTRLEWMMICAELAGKDGDLDGNILAEKLGVDLPSYWWSSTVSSETYSYVTYINSSGYVYAGSYYYGKRYGFAVRCVRGELWGGGGSSE